MTDLGRMITQLEKRIAAVEGQSRLSSASLDDTSLVVKDAAGSLRGILGQQGDGTTAVTIVNGGPPPAPSTPTAGPALGGVAAGWDGTFADGAIIPMDWARVEVHASEDAGFTPTAETLVATIETAQGGIVYVPATAPMYVRLLARNTSGTASTPTPAVGPYAPRPVAGDIGIGEITETLIADGAVTTPKVFANAITTAKLSVGSVDATALKADAITGKTITGGEVNGAVVTGGVVQTASSGQRIVLNPSATDPETTGETVPSLELHSGYVGQIAPAQLYADIEGGGGDYPYVSLRSPSVSSDTTNALPINAELTLLSPQEGVRGGSVVLQANANAHTDQIGQAYFYGYTASSSTETSGARIFAADGVDAPGGDGTRGPYSFVTLSGGEVMLRATSNAGDGYLFVHPTGASITGALSVSGTFTLSGKDAGKGLRASVSRDTNLINMTNVNVAVMTTPSMTWENGRSYRVDVVGLISSTSSGTYAVFQIVKGTTAGGAVIRSQIRIPLAATTNTWVDPSIIISNVTGANITTAITLTGSVAAGTGQFSANPNSLAYINIVDIGLAADWPGVPIT